MALVLSKHAVSIGLILKETSNEWLHNEQSRWSFKNSMTLYEGTDTSTSHISEVTPAGIQSSFQTPNSFQVAISILKLTVSSS